MVAEVARRIALHLAPVAAVVDVELVVLGGGIGSNGDLLLEPVRRLLASWLPFPPQVEVSTVGEAAVLAGRPRGGSSRRAGERRARRGGLSATVPRLARGAESS